MRDKLISFKIIDYIRQGGFFGIQKNFEIVFDEIKNNADEIFINKNSAILTYNKVYWSLEFIFLDKQYIADQIEIYIESIYSSLKKIKNETEVNYLQAFIPTINHLILNAFWDDSEVVLFLENGINIHFNKSKLSDDFIIRKIIPYSRYTKTNRELISSFMHPYSWRNHLE